MIFAELWHVFVLIVLAPLSCPEIERNKYVYCVTNFI